MMPGGIHLFEQLRRLRLEMESMNESMDERFGTLRTEMRDGFARLAATCDQSIAGVQQDLRRSQRNQSVIWGALMERSAETQAEVAELKSDTAELKSDTADLKRRVEELERRVAG